ncbi:MAG: ATP-binding protein [Bacteroidales bacterium]|nr:ATP-binding protein [Bacteroidales bacterium]
MKKEIVLHNDIREIPELTAFIGELAREASLNDALAMTVNLALEEAVANVMQYAYPKGTSGLVEVRAALAGRLLRFVISDSGVPFDPTKRPDADITQGVEERPIGGLGIFLVRRLMDSVSYARESGKNELTLIKKI